MGKPLVIENDILGQQQTVETLRMAIETTPTPGCIALYGPWGSGKTSILNTVYSKWTGPKVWFDPWQYAQRGDVITPLLMEILKQLELRQPGTGRLGQLVLGATKTVLSIATRGALGFLFGGMLDPSLKVGSLAALKPEEFAQHFDQVTAAVDEVLTLKGQFRELIDLALETHRAEVDEGNTRRREANPPLAPRPTADRVLICLDDLDRCLPDDVVVLIEAVKLLFAGDPNAKVIFAFALDRQVVGEAIRQRYPGASQYTGENYLEKIFDLSLAVPPVPDAKLLTLFCDEAIGQRLASTPGTPFVTPGELAKVLAEPFLANPRVISRAIRRLELLLAAAPAREALKQQLGGINQGQDRRRFLLWLAGVERYRAFRHFLRSASQNELTAIARLASGKGNGTDEQVRRANPFVDAPGFSAFYQAVTGAGEPGAPATPGRSERAWATFAELAAMRPGTALTTIQEFDYLMSLVGV